MKGKRRRSADPDEVLLSANLPRIVFWIAHSHIDSVCEEREGREGERILEFNWNRLFSAVGAVQITNRIKRGGNMEDSSIIDNQN